AAELPEGSTTVGGHIASSHLRPTAVGAKVVAIAEVTRVEGRKIELAVSAYCGDTLIGEGTHVRYVVDRDQFMQRLSGS
ncbi:MAG: dihydrolipoamide acyltransferase, partial [Muribaculaceae bacterium]|nr:dihydrolipoamide acyltransferase [Muribaculaceae bacterium]